MDIRLKFKEWVSAGKKRVYLADTEATESIYIEQLVGSQEPRIRGRETNIVMRYQHHISMLGFDFGRAYPSWEDMVDALFSLPGVHTRAGSKAGAGGRSGFSQQSGYTQGTIYDKVDIRTPQEISDQASSYPIDSAPFKKTTLDSCKIIIDTREPSKLVGYLAQGKIAIDVGALEIGDIKIVSNNTQDHIIIERKTITDFYSAITGDDHRAHSQAERLYDYQQKQHENGVRVLVLWMIEGDLNGRRMLYNTLPESRQTDGMINYLVAILGQHVIQAFNMHHLCYLVSKFTQGFFEQQLYYPVRTATGSQIDRKKSERAPMVSVGGSGQHGVSIPGRADLFHVLTAFKSIDSRVANSMIGSGLTLKSIMDLSKEDLRKFDGVGPTLAQRIFEEFNS